MFLIVHFLISNFGPRKITIKTRKLFCEFTCRGNIRKLFYTFSNLYVHIVLPVNWRCYILSSLCFAYTYYSFWVNRLSSWLVDSIAKQPFKHVWKNLIESWVPSFPPCTFRFGHVLFLNNFIDNLWLFLMCDVSFSLSLIHTPSIL